MCTVYVWWRYSSFGPDVANSNTENRKLKIELEQKRTKTGISSLYIERVVDCGSAAPSYSTLSTPIHRILEDSLNSSR